MGEYLRKKREEKKRKSLNTIMNDSFVVKTTKMQKRCDVEVKESKELNESAIKGEIYNEVKGELKEQEEHNGKNVPTVHEKPSKELHLDYLELSDAPTNVCETDKNDAISNDCKGTQEQSSLIDTNQHDKNTESQSNGHNSFENGQSIGIL